jgi:hypothetical protein
MYKYYWFTFGFWILIFISNPSVGQEVYFFSEGTGSTFYDQGIVDKGNLGQSTFEYTFPPAAPQYNDKVPCSTTAFKGSTALKFNYFSSANGNWKASIYRNDWSSADISKLDSFSFYIYSETTVPADALPLIGFRAANMSGTGDLNSKLYKLSDFNGAIGPNKWTQVKFPLALIFNDSENSSLNFSVVKGVIFNQSEKNNTSRLILIDEITAFKSISEIPAVAVFSATGYDSHAELNWEQPSNGLTYRIYASFDGGQTFETRTETTDNSYLDFVPQNGKNKTVTYRIASLFQGKESAVNEKHAVLRDFSDDELLDMVQRYTFRYFWEGAHQPTGMALERTNGSGRTAASGATGMGLMAMIVAHEREFRPREDVKDRILMILDFLEKCERHYGAWSHWYNADTYKTQPFSQKDNGGDIVETSFVAQALIALKHYFAPGSDSKSKQIREIADRLWKEIDWDWYRQNRQNTLYWHWSPDYGFEMNMQVRGWNEALITYIMAAASPTHGIPKEVYTNGWARNGNMVKTARKYYGHEITLAPNWGGPLFFIHYTHHGINPHGLKDQYADYWKEHVNTAKIHYEYGKANPLNFMNYSEKSWGLTASDDPDGYTAHKPMDNDNGTVSPTAALASMPYTPEESIKALKYFYRERGRELFGIYGPYDAFNDSRNWVQQAYIGIDQGPIVIMIENYRTQLLWKYVMMDEDVQAGLDKLGFQYEVITNNIEISKNETFEVYPNPAGNEVFIRTNGLNKAQTALIKIFSMDGRLIKDQQLENTGSSIDCSVLQNGLYLIRLHIGDKVYQSKLVIQKK